MEASKSKCVAYHNYKEVMHDWNLPRVLGTCVSQGYHILNVDSHGATVVELYTSVTYKRKMPFLPLKAIVYIFGIFVYTGKKVFDSDLHATWLCKLQNDHPFFWGTCQTSMV
jgi:hypothetical protein